ncbi:LysR family transcriptional regulator [Salinisphaera hydrothermalis C41B8]|uniref:LysR family transcriptional regulator n=2 Tax=Salinisphaera TaxID=180541 RepID=A0A084IJ76_SALHC|nr:LysR family transcriptional regulator [Salinisphaera hydrothermalis C41B8]
MRGISFAKASGFAMPRNIEIRLLRTFVAAVHHGSMAKAATALHLTQGAVSQQIKRLETVLGQHLLERGSYGLNPTVDGARLLRHAEDMLDRNDRFVAEARPGKLDAPVRLGLPGDLIGRYMPAILSSVATTDPDMELSVRSATSPELDTMLRSGELDLAVLEAPERASGSTALISDRLVWVGGSASPVHTRRPLPLSFVSEGCVFRSSVLDALRGHHIPWVSRFEGGNLEATTAAVAGGLAITVSLESVVPPQLHILPPESGLPALPRFSIHLCRNSGSRSASIDRASEFICRAIEAA